MRIGLVTVLSFFLILSSQTLAFSMDETEVTKRARKLVDDWQGWLEKHKVGEAAIAISYKGETVAEFGYGDRTVSDLAPVASVSKSVTGICIAQLVEAGRFSFGDSLNSIVPELNSDVSVSSLLKQTSGFTRDITQKPEKYKGRDKEFQEWVARKEIEKGFDETQSGKFHYNNSNYAMLGAIIRKVTGKTYEAACKELVFEPIGIDKVDLNPDWRIHAAFGGWRISARDHLKFLNAYFGDDEIYGKTPFNWPSHDFGNGLNYGMGYMFRSGRAGGFNFWHDGRWHVDLDGQKYRYGAFFVSFDNGWKITTNHNISAINGEHRELDSLIGKATHLPL